LKTIDSNITSLFTNGNIVLGEYTQFRIIDEWIKTGVQKMTLIAVCVDVIGSRLQFEVVKGNYSIWSPRIRRW